MNYKIYILIIVIIQINYLNLHSIFLTTKIFQFREESWTKGFTVDVFN